MKNKIVNAILLLGFFCGCNNAPTHPPFTDTPTSGEITIVVDESYQPLIQVQIDTFLKIYKYAKINVRYLPESEVFKALLNDDSVRIAITARELTENEKQFLDQQKIIPRTLPIAYDAVTLIVNKENPDTAITYEQLHDIMLGKISQWSQLGNNKSDDSIRIVFDRSGSANASFLKDKFLKNNEMPSNSFASKSNGEVIDYVNANKNTLGVIGLNWISDKDDSLTGSFLEKIKVVALSMPDTSDNPTVFRQPYQGYIAMKQYPLIRTVNIISREGRNGLGMGFSSFVAGDSGQRLIRLMGLLPAAVPVRVVRVH